jgi:uncharacterized hydrophobic protein (TIGR00271 family)
MSILSRFQSIDQADKTRAVRKLVKDATPDFDFFFMITLAVLMATFGLLAGSETVVIGSMLLAPILHPVLGVALGISMSDHRLIRRSLVTVGKAALVSIVAAIAATFLFAFGADGHGINDIILARTAPSLLFLVVAIVSGLAVAYSIVKPDLSEALPGIAVSVALIPPLAVIGIGIAWFSPAMVAGASMMFAVNVLGIVAAAMASFSLMDVHEERTVAEKTITQEEKRVEREEKKVREVDEELTAATE